MAIYLDHAATSPMTPAVIAAYVEALAVVGNPSSIHSQGQNARRILEEAREAVATSVGADAVEVTFTSGGTEAINLALKGLFWSSRRSSLSRPRIVSTRAEHHATIDTLAWLEQHEGAIVEWIPVDALGRVDLDALAAALGPDVAFVTTLLANNEVGTIQPVAEIVSLAAAHGIPVHADAVSAYGHLPIDFRKSGLAALSISAHKVGGPVGIGALFIARGITVTPLMHGGNQQRARSGTLDSAGAVAFGVAATTAARAAAGAAGAAGAAAAGGAAASESSAGDALDASSLADLRDHLIAGIRSAVPTAVLRGDESARLPGNVHFTFPGCEGDSLLFLLDAAGFSVSTGSACQAGVPEASHVLLAMGLTEEDARGALRFSLAQSTARTELDALIAALPAIVDRARSAGLASPASHKLAPPKLAL